MGNKKKAKAKANPKAKPKTKSQAKPKAKLSAKPKTKAKTKTKAPAPKSPAKKSAATGAPRPTMAKLASTFVTPLDNRLLVQLEEGETRTAGGIIIPGTVAERPNRGVILAVGRGHRNKKGVIRPLDVKVGDTVMFPEFAGTKIEIQSAQCLIIREDEILGVIAP